VNDLKDIKHQFVQFYIANISIIFLVKLWSIENVVIYIWL